MVVLWLGCFYLHLCLFEVLDGLIPQVHAKNRPSAPVMSFPHVMEDVHRDVVYRGSELSSVVFTSSREI